MAEFIPANVYLPCNYNFRLSPGLDLFSPHSCAYILVSASANAKQQKAFQWFSSWHLPCSALEGTEGWKLILGEEEEKEVLSTFA
jgi:hypothetical protein